MRIAILSDIHANLEALQACLAAAEAECAEQLVFLGDVVGYGADPQAVTEIVMARVAAGAVAILGNHDAALADGGQAMHGVARAAIDWTRTRLGEAQRRFLTALPISHEYGNRLFVHANAAAPSYWDYVDSARSAEQSLRCVSHHLVVCGHLHVPAVYHQPPLRAVSRFVPVVDVPIPLSVHRRWLAVVGACGQPRDGNPAASYAMLDTTAGTLTFRRVPYDIASAAAKIRDAGLPEVLAARLERGR